VRTETTLQPPPAPVPAPRAAPAKPRAAAPLSSRRSPAFAFFCAYAAFVVYATLLPFQFTTDPASLSAKRQWINWDPRVLQTGEPTPVADVVINILFFVPLGFIGVHAQRRRPTAVLVARGALAGTLLSLGVETLQFFTPSRNPATSDVLTNGLGAALGALLAVWARAHVQGAVMRRATAWMAREPLLVILAGDALLVALAALVPFDFLITVSGLRRGVRLAQLDPRGGGGLDVLGELPAALQYALFAGLAWFVARRLHRAGAVARASACVVGAALLAGGLEIVQLLMRSHVCSSRDVLAAMCGAALGVSGAAALFAARRSGWVAALAVVLACVTVQALSPFRFDFDWTAMRDRVGWTSLVPYSSYYYKANVAAVADLLEGLLAYIPAGFIIARLRAGRDDTGARRVTTVQVALTCAAMALLLELLQLGLPRRYPEISDVLTAGLGGLLGVSAWRWFAALRPATPPSAPASS
jgi:glycopeptide antibiotics resistance protein